jgi:hypothetical protein
MSDPRLWALSNDRWPGDTHIPFSPSPFSKLLVYPGSHRRFVTFLKLQVVFVSFSFLIERRNKKVCENCRDVDRRDLPIDWSLHNFASDKKREAADSFACIVAGFINREMFTPAQSYCPVASHGRLPGPSAARLWRTPMQISEPMSPVDK